VSITLKSRLLIYGHLIANPSQPSPKIINVHIIDQELIRYAKCKVLFNVLSQLNETEMCIEY
jgi:hypothetical protein